MKSILGLTFCERKTLSRSVNSFGRFQANIYYQPCVILPWLNKQVEKIISEALKVSKEDNEASEVEKSLGKSISHFSPGFPFFSTFLTFTAP